MARQKLSLPKPPTIAPDRSGVLVGKPKPKPTMPQNPLGPAPADKAVPQEPQAVLAPVIPDGQVTPPGKPVKPVNEFKPSGPSSGPLVASAPAGSGLHALRRR